MTLLNTPNDFLYNLKATSSVEARRLWRKSIKDKWNNKCAYCESPENLTIDHVVPQCRGGIDFLTNVVCCCQSCNQDKGHKDWEEWYSRQEFFTLERKNAIIAWQKQFMNQNLVKYKPRKNTAY